MDIRIISEQIPIAEVEELAREIYRDMVKGAADIDRGVIALGGEWHMDANTVLLSAGSKQENIWGFNVYPHERGEGAIEYLSLINIRPAQGNREMYIGDPTIREKVRTIVGTCIPELAL